MIKGGILLGIITFIVLYFLFSLSSIGDARNVPVAFDAFVEGAWDRCCADFYDETVEDITRFKQD